MKMKHLRARRRTPVNGTVGRVLEIGKLGLVYARKGGRLRLGVAKTLTNMENYPLAALAYADLGLKGRARAVGEKLEKDGEYHTAGRVFARIGDKAGTFRCLEALDGIARTADKLAEIHGQNGGAHLVPGFVEAGVMFRSQTRELLERIPL